jgi:hypothetical protein
MSEPYDDQETDERTEGLEEVDVEALKAQLEQKEQDIQKLKGRWGSERQELTERLAKLEGRVEERDVYSNSQRQPEKDPRKLTEEEIESFNNNPSDMWERMYELMETREQQRMSAIAEALKARDDYEESRHREVVSTVQLLKKEVDPELMPWKEAIGDLRKDESLAKLDDETLIAIAKKMGKGPAMEYRGSAGGGVTRSGGQKAVPFNPNSPECRVFIDVAQGDVERAKKWWESRQRKQVG